MQLKENLQKRFPLIIAVVCGILAIFLLNVYLQRREAEIWQKMKQAQQQAQRATPPVKTGIVLVAKNNIASQVPITPADLLIREVPVEYIQPGAVASLEQVIGQIASAPFAKGEQIIKTKLLPPGRVSKSLSEITPEGKRAVTVSIDNISSVAGLLNPGDYVDVSTLISPPSGMEWPDGRGAAPRLVSLFQGVEVLAVGGELSVSPAGEKARAKMQSAAAANTVTLALDSQEAILLSFVQEHGKIKLTLRSSEDAEIESVKAADWDSLFEYLYPRRGVALEGKQPVVEIYRGLQRDVIPLSE